VTAEWNTEQPSSGPRALLGLRVLLVEDTWVTAEALKMALEMEGATVIGPAATVTAAHQLAESAVCDVAVVDVNLQGEMTYDLIADLSARSTPVIVMSGYDLPPAMSGNVLAVLRKPFSPELLMQYLREIPAPRPA
jgi:DNA-binding response OmpR family regulator